MRVLVVLAGLALVLIPVQALAGGGGGCRQTITDGEPLVVNMTESCFGPEILEARPGETITFVNQDAYGHTVTGAGLAWGSTEILSYGDTIDVSFTDPGVYPYMCILHPGMAGAVVVDADDAAETVAAPPLRQPSAGETSSIVPALVLGGLAAAIVIVAVRASRPGLRPRTDL